MYRYRVCPGSPGRVFLPGTVPGKLSMIQPGWGLPKTRARARGADRRRMRSFSVPRLGRRGFLLRVSTMDPCCSERSGARRSASSARARDVRPCLLGIVPLARAPRLLERARAHARGGTHARRGAPVISSRVKSKTGKRRDLFNLSSLAMPSRASIFLTWTQ